MIEKTTINISEYQPYKKMGQSCQLKDIARKKGLVYIDLYSAFVTPDNKLNLDYSIDGLHLNGAGYELWVKLISKYL